MGLGPRTLCIQGKSELCVQRERQPTERGVMVIVIERHDERMRERKQQRDTEIVRRKKEKEKQG